MAICGFALARHEQIASADGAAVDGNAVNRKITVAVDIDAAVNFCEGLFDLRVGPQGCCCWGHGLLLPLCSSVQSVF